MTEFLDFYVFFKCRIVLRNIVRAPSVYNCSLPSNSIYFYVGKCFKLSNNAVIAMIDLLHTVQSRYLFPMLDLKCTMEGTLMR